MSKKTLQKDMRRRRMSMARVTCLVMGLLILSACGSTPKSKEKPWTEIPGVAESPEQAMTRLVTFLWDEQGKFDPGRYRRYLTPMNRLAVAAVVNSDTEQRTLFSQRLENLMVQRLEEVSRLKVLPRREMVGWEEDFVLKREPKSRAIRPFKREASLNAAGLGIADAVLFASYQIDEGNIVVSGEFLRLTPGLPRPFLSMARAKVALALSSVPLNEFIAQLPLRKRGILPIPPEDWTWNPISIWYEVIGAAGKRQRGVDGAVLRHTDTFLVSFLAARPIHVMVIRIDNQGEIRVLFPERSRDISEKVKVGRRYSVPDRMAKSSHWASAYVLYSDNPFRYRRDVLPGIRNINARIRAGASQGVAQAGLDLPKGIYQQQIWFTQRGDREKKRSSSR
jgi:hypothetical protein